MKIKVEVNIPRGKHCSAKCVFKDIDSYFCNLFCEFIETEYIKMDKCPACLEACTKAGKERG